MPNRHSERCRRFRMTSDDHFDSEQPTMGPDAGEGDHLRGDPRTGQPPSSLHDMVTHAESSDALDSESPTMVPLGGRSVGGTSFERSVPGFSIRRVLGQGGMGAVYLAEQEKPRRTVALKVIRPDRVTEATLKRFDYEAELLASMRHPGIAAVYEAGSYEHDGCDTPYFAMEYIAGAKTITKFADDESLGSSTGTSGA